MSEGSQEYKILNDEGPLSADLFLRFWREKGVSLECELCAHPLWSAAIQILNARPIVPFKNADSGADSGFLEICAATCQNCGNVRSFNRYVIDQWLKQVNLGAADATRK